MGGSISDGECRGWMRVQGSLGGNTLVGGGTGLESTLGLAGTGEGCCSQHGWIDSCVFCEVAVGVPLEIVLG